MTDIIRDAVRDAVRQQLSENMQDILQLARTEASNLVREVADKRISSLPQMKASAELQIALYVTEQVKRELGGYGTNAGLRTLIKSVIATEIGLLTKEAIQASVKEALASMTPELIAKMIMRGAR